MIDRSYCYGLVSLTLEETGKRRAEDLRMVQPEYRIKSTNVDDTHITEIRPSNGSMDLVVDTLKAIIRSWASCSDPCLVTHVHESIVAREHGVKSLFHRWLIVVKLRDYRSDLSVGIWCC
jgi:hypothetical protein